MCVSRDENINIKLSLNHRQTVSVTPRHHLMTVTESNTKTTDRHHLLLRVVEILQPISQSPLHKLTIANHKNTRIRCT